jgi:hypothetical protein
MSQESVIGQKIADIQMAIFDSELLDECPYDITVNFYRCGRCLWNAYLLYYNDEEDTHNTVKFNVGGKVVDAEFQAKSPELALDGLHKSILRLVKELEANNSAALEADWEHHVVSVAHTD